MLGRRRSSVVCAFVHANAIRAKICRRVSTSRRHVYRPAFQRCERCLWPRL